MANGQADGRARIARGTVAGGARRQRPRRACLCHGHSRAREGRRLARHYGLCAHDARDVANRQLWYARPAEAVRPAAGDWPGSRGFRLDGARCRERRRGHANDGGAARSCLHPQRLEDLHYARRSRRDLRGNCRDRPGCRSQGHQLLHPHEADGGSRSCAGRRHGARRVAAGDAGVSRRQEGG